MNSFPRTYSAKTAPEGTVDAIKTVMPLLLSGDDLDAETLRMQYAAARITSVELTGAGFYADFDVPSTMPTTIRPEYSGGTATLRLSDVRNGGGCVVFVRDGRLKTLEVYTYDEPWSEATRVVAVERVTPLCRDSARQ